MPDLTLTFDNGPDPDVTPMVLDVLARHGIATTFFVIGSKLTQPGARACAERAKEEGHWIGNHTWTHSRPLGEQPGRAPVEREIIRAQEEIGTLSSTPPLFRPMGGGGNLDRRLLSAEALAHLRSADFTCVLWNAIPRDWADPVGWVDRALDQITLQPWTLMVLHDLPTGAMKQLDRFLDEAAQRGVRFRQDFPDDCTPLRPGYASLALDSYVTH